MNKLDNPRILWYSNSALLKIVAGLHAMVLTRTPQAAPKLAVKEVV
jgi:hypothetical protein